MMTKNVDFPGATRACLGALAVAAFLLALSGHSPAQTAAGIQPGQKALEYEVTVSLKLVQAYVTDKAGKAVTDLDQGDFMLTVDGKPREITDFERHTLSGAEKAKEVLVATPARPAAPMMSRKFIMLIDLARNDHLGLKRTAEAALRFLDDDVLPSDEVAVMTYGALGGISLYANLTTDHAMVRRIIQGIVGIPGTGTSGGIPLKGEALAPTEVEPVWGDENFDMLSSGFDADWEIFKKKTFDFALAMENLARSLRYIPGFKNIIYFSEGVPRSLLYDLEDSKVRTEYEAMIKEFTSANCPVFSVNVEGQRAFLKKPDSRGDHALEILSERSGGKYFYDAAQDGKIAESIQDMTANFYVLGFRVNEAWDGKFHEIRVGVRRPGCKVYAQAGYYSPQRFKKLTKFEKEIDLYDLALNPRPRSQAPLVLPMAALPGPAGEGPDLVLLSEIAVSEMEDVLGNGAEMLALVFDGLNKVVVSRRGEISRNSLGEPAYVPYFTASLPPGHYKCRFVFRNLDTGRAAVAAAGVTVPGLSPGRMVLSPPLLLIPGRPASYMEFSGSEKKEPEREMSALRQVYPEVDAGASPVVDAVERGTSRLTAMARYSVPVSEAAAPAFRASLLKGASGERIALSLSVVKTVRGKPVSQKAMTAGAAAFRVDTLVAEIDLPDLAPGSYRLVLEAEDAASGQKAVATREFRIK
jgi:VWFA-related protein